MEPHQARAFRLLGLADNPDLSLAAAAALLDMDIESAEDLVESLVDASLLESAAPGRYRFHDLVRLYARSCAERDEHPPTERDAALSRLLDFYLATAARVYLLERPGDRLVDHMEPTNYPGLDVTDRTTALEWLFSEAGCLLACAKQSHTKGALRRAADLLMLTKDFAESGAYALQYEQANMSLLAAARELDDQHAQARIHTALTYARTLAGRLDEADENAKHAMLLGVATNDPFSSSYAPNDRGIIAGEQGRHADAEEYLCQALIAFRADDNKQSEASALCNLSRVHLDTGRVDSAIRLAEQGVAIYRQIGATRRLANGMYALGVAFTLAQRLTDAAQQFNEALVIFRDSRQRFWEGMTYFRLAEVELAAHRPAQAANHAEQALGTLRVTGGELWRANALTALGRALNGVGHIGRARVCWQEALAIYERLGSTESAKVQQLLSVVSAA